MLGMPQEYNTGIYTKMTSITGPLLVLQTLDLDPLGLPRKLWYQAIRRIRVHMAAMNHKSWSPFPSKTAALKVPIRHPGAFQECLKNGAIGCHRPHPENDVLVRSDHITSLSTWCNVQQMCSLLKIIWHRRPVSPCVHELLTLYQATRRSRTHRGLP